MPDTLNAYLLPRRSALTYEDRKPLLATTGGALTFNMIKGALRKLFGDDELKEADAKSLAGKRKHRFNQGGPTYYNQLLSAEQAQELDEGG